MVCILWLYKNGTKPRDVYGADSVAFALMRPGDVFTYADSYNDHDGSYVVSERRVSVSHSRSTIELVCVECAPESERAQ